MTGTAKLGTVAVIGSVSSAAGVFLPAAPWTADLFGWLRDAGAAGVALYALLFVVAAICLVPGSILTVGAGAAFGVVWGTVIASIASAAAATAAFLVARTIARERVARWAASDPRMAALDAAVGDQGLKIVVLVRLSPLIPFNVLNYALGLTRVGLRDYVLGTFLGMLPVTVLYVYLGSLAGQLAAITRGTATGGPLRHAVSALGLAATIALTVHLTRIARRALDGALPRAGRAAAAEAPTSGRPHRPDAAVRGRVPAPAAARVISRSRRASRVEIASGSLLK